MQRLDPARLADAARFLEAEHNDVAKFLRALAAADGDARARVARKAALRAIWRTRYFGTARTAAARLIAVEWQAVAAGHDVPADVAEAYADLAGIRPISPRAIVDDLDPSMD